MAVNITHNKAFKRFFFIEQTQKISFFPASKSAFQMQLQVAFELSFGAVRVVWGASFPPRRWTRRKGCPRDGYMAGWGRVDGWVGTGGWLG